jgi:hypothetical protein
MDGQKKISSINKYLIDLLIDYYLTSSKQYFSYIQNENKFNNI